MTIKITRSFSKKIQLKQFEPIDVFCGAEAEGDIENPSDPNSMTLLRRLSNQLDDFCRAEVDKTLAIVRPALKESGKGKVERKEISHDEAENDSGNE